MKDVCLVGEMFAGKDEINYITSMRTLGISYLASCLRKKGFTVDIIDPILHQYSVEDCFQIIQKCEYKYFGFSIMLNYSYTMELIRRLREDGYSQHFTIGGVYVTTNNRYILTYNQDIGIDSAIIGEGEETIVELVSCLERDMDWRKIQSIAYISDGKFVINERRERIKKLDTVPFPAMDDVSYCIENHMPVSVYTSRGCPGTCLYCGSNNLLNDKKNNWICRTAENVMQEIRLLYHQYQVRRISFVDDNFVGSLDVGVHRAKEICKKIIEEKIEIEFFLECRPDSLTEELVQLLYLAGCRTVFLGIESASEERLKEMGRPTLSPEKNQNAINLLNKYKIEPMIGFMMFTPNSKIEDIKINISFFEKYIEERFVGNFKTQAITSILFSDLIAIPGTFTRKILEKELRINEKDGSYIPSDPNVYLLRTILKDYDIQLFITSIEKRIRREWIDIYTKNQINKISHIKFYEKKLVLMSINFLKDIVNLIEIGNMIAVTSVVILFKRDVLNFSSYAIRKIRKMLKEGE